MAYTSRLVRVFISSTFRDMQEERDYLVKHVFPELRQRCRERQVEFVEVDLRWGVTEEQADRGEVLPICLREISCWKNCKRRRMTKRQKNNHQNHNDQKLAAGKREPKTTQEVSQEIIPQAQTQRLFKACLPSAPCHPTAGRSMVSIGG